MADKRVASADPATPGDERRLERIVACSPAVLYTLRVDGDRLVPTWRSPRLLELTGHAAAEALAEDWWVQHLHPDDRDEAAAEASRIVEKEHLVLEYRLRARDGSYRWIRDELRLLRDAHGHPLEAVGSWMDVTDRRRAEEALHESEDRYRVLFEASPIPMWLYDPKSFRILAANAATTRQYGYTHEELLELTIRDVRPPEDVAKLLAASSTAARGPRTAGVWRHRRKDGTLLDVEVHTDEVRIGDQMLRLALLVDVSEKTHLEEQVRQNQKMEAIGRLAGGLAHDFNNLLTVITGYGGMLLTQLGESDPRREFAEEIVRAGDRAADLTRQLLAFSRKQVLSPRVLDLNAVVRDMEKMLRRLIGEQIELVTDLALESQHVRADPGQLEQVIMNLTVNARDAMPHGGRLTLETRSAGPGPLPPELKTAPGPFAFLTISDTGTGMDAETKAHLFEPFFTTKAKGQGTGLGLATVYGIVRQSGGHLTVDSEPGRGTTFRICFPLAENPKQAPEPPARETPSAIFSLRGTETILLVEDEDAVRRLTRSSLEERGYTVLAAGGATDALETVARHSGVIHLLVTDVVMPGLNGPALAGRLRELKPDLRVLFVSGYSDEAIALDGVLGMDTAFLAKPFAPRELAVRVRALLDSPARA